MANKQITVNCYDLTFDGKGVVKYQDKIGFVDNRIFGRIIFKTPKKRKSYIFYI